MRPVFSTLVCALSCGAFAAGQAQSGESINLPIILVSSAPQSESQLALLKLKRLSDLTSAAGTQEFDVVVKDNAIWLVPASFSGAEIKREFASVCESLRELVVKNGSRLNKRMLSPEQRRRFDRQLAIVGAALRSRTASVLLRDDLHFGFAVMQAVVLTDGDRTITLRAREKIGPRRFENLNKFEGKTGYDADTEQAIERLLKDVKLPSVGFLNELHFAFSSKPQKPRVRAGLVRELMEYLEQELSEADAVAREAEGSLIDLLVLESKTGYKDVLTKGTPFHDIDSKLKSLFEAELEMMYSSYGFESDADLAAFFASATVIAYGRDLQIVIPKELPDGRKTSTGYPLGSDLGH